MTDEKYKENLREFFDRISRIGLIERIFFWKRFYNSYFLKAHKEFNKIEIILDNVEKGEQKLIEEKVAVENQNKVLIGKIEEKEKILIEKNIEISNLKKDIQILIEDKKELSNKITEYRTNENKNKVDFERRIIEMSESKKHYEDLEKKIIEQRENEIREEQKKREVIWKNHEIKVENEIKKICHDHQVSRVEKGQFPYKGAPDNVLFIAGLYVIFDAKAPSSEDIAHFKTKYISGQAKNLIKYAKHADVKNDLFLVVPTNVIDEINEKYMHEGEYHVYVISVDSLRPVILTLQMIENYKEFADLSPEDRENIARIIGRFANTAKMKIIMDSAFIKHSIKDLMECDTLPEEIKKEVLLVEKNTHLPLPRKNKGKETKINTLAKYAKEIEKEGEHMGINMNLDFKSIENIPLDKKKK